MCVDKMTSDCVYLGKLSVKCVGFYKVFVREDELICAMLIEIHMCREELMVDNVLFTISL
jgi:hypothetical protein